MMPPPPISAEHARPRIQPPIRTWRWSYQEFETFGGGVDTTDWESARHAALGLLRLDEGIALSFADPHLLVWLPLPKRERRAPRIL